MRRAGGLAAATLALLLGPSAAAHAHSIVRISSGELTSLSADATSLNTLTARVSGGRVELRDPTVDGGMDPGPCDPGDVDSAGYVVQTFCPRDGLDLVRIDAGDREDKITAEVPIATLLLGGQGADVLRSGPAADTLDGGPGVDELDAGGGDDRLRARDGLGDTVRCGDGADRVDADTLDEVAADCEVVSRTATPPPPGDGDGGRDRTAPRVDVGGRTSQKLGSAGAIRLVATSSERGTLAASGSLEVGGLALPLLSRRERVTVAGGGAELRIRLSASQLRRVRRALRDDRRVRVRLEVVATDAAGNSAARRAPAIRLRP